MLKHDGYIGWRLKRKGSVKTERSIYRKTKKVYKNPNPPIRTKEEKIQLYGSTQTDLSSYTPIINEFYDIYNIYLKYTRNRTIEDSESTKSLQLI